MANCGTLVDFEVGCRKIAGIQEVYIGQWNGTELQYSTQADGTIATFSAGTVSFYTFQQTIETGSYTFPAEFGSSENNTVAYTQTAMITIQGMSQTLANQIAILGKGVWRVILLDKEGNYWFMGVKGPVQATALEGGLGKASTDLNGATITFTSKESVPLTAMTEYAASQLIV